MAIISKHVFQEKKFKNFVGPKSQRKKNIFGRNFFFGQFIWKGLQNVWNRSFQIFHDSVTFLNAHKPIRGFRTIRDRGDKKKNISFVTQFFFLIFFLKHFLAQKNRFWRKKSRFYFLRIFFFEKMQSKKMQKNGKILIPPMGGIRRKSIFRPLIVLWRPYKNIRGSHNVG